MNLLFANDKKGHYPDSWYAASTALLPPLPALEGSERTDVCIVGAGYTGLSAALHLAEAGRKVILLEAHRVGFGASGRNGGQLGSGQRVEQPHLEKMIGFEAARLLWGLGEDAKSLVKSLIARHDIDCHLRPGIAWAGRNAASVKDLHDYADHMAQHYDHPLEVLSKDAFQALCPSPDYVGGILDMSAAHLHPLAFAVGLTRAAISAGADLRESSLATRIIPGQPATVHTAKGTVTADHIILACNGYLGDLSRKVAAHVMPINNFVAATEPLDARTSAVLTRDIAVADDRFVVNYFRLSHDGRLLFGGGESYGYRFPADIAGVVRKPMLKVFPHLKDVRIDYAWGGTLAITMKRLPYLARVDANILSASGYSGHGLGTASHAGFLMARAIEGDGDGFDTMADIPNLTFPGGPRFRSPLLALAMSWYALRDRLGF